MADEVVSGDDRFGALLGRPSGPGWVAADEMFGPGLGDALDAAAARRGTPGPAVAGALLVEQYAMRLALPVVAVFVRDGSVLDAGPSQVSIEFDDGVVRRLAFTPPESCRRAGSSGLGAALQIGFEPIAEAVHRRTRVGLRTLRGAMANAVANAFLHLSWPCADRARYLPEARAVLGAAGWADLVRLQDVDGWMYTDRATCCLAFRTSVNAERDQHYCLTCPITPRETTMAEFLEATASYSERHPR